MPHLQHDGGAERPVVHGLQRAAQLLGRQLRLCEFDEDVLRRRRLQQALLAVCGTGKYMIGASTGYKETTIALIACHNVRFSRLVMARP